VRLTANFERNLAAVGEFLSAEGAQHAFEALVARLEARTIPALERFPDIGAAFTAKAPLSREGRLLFEQMVALSGAAGEVRQLVEDDYVILYLVRGTSIFLLSIKHHRQLSFDFAGHWP
jgi:ParE toxin of type II toxin-antitoxin system, parDE